MIAIRQTEVYSEWLRKLRDRRAAAIVVACVERLAYGNPGDVKSVGEGICELRIHFGRG